MSDISNFRSIIHSRRGLAKSARFKVRIAPNTGFLSQYTIFLNTFPFLCADAEIAGVSLNTVDNRIYGPLFKTPSQVAYNDVTLFVLTSEDMMERAFFGDWIDYIAGDGTYDFRFREEYATTIFIDKLRERDPGADVEFTLELRNAYPVQVMALPVSWGDEAFVRTQVQFSYTHHLQHRPDSTQKAYNNLTYL